MIYFTADTHFGHKGVIDYCNRPFDSVEQMDEALISNWNEKVEKSDTIYILGDMFFGTKEHAIKILNRLKGQKFLIYGNHDSRLRSGAFEKFFQWRGDIKEMKHEGTRFVLCHFAMRTWHKQHKGAIQLYGHSHGKLSEDIDSLQCDVGVDNTNYYPVSIEAITEYMKDKAETIEHLAKDRYNKR